MKYLKWAYGNNVGNKENETFKEGEVMVSDVWNPTTTDWNKQGGFNFTNEENALRWIARGDTLYDVKIPDGEEVINVPNYKTPNGIYRANKIILTNPRVADDKMTLDLYKKSNMPEKTYFESIAALAMRGCYETALEIIKDKVSEDNIDIVIEEYNNFLKPWHEGYINYDVYNKVKENLEEIKNRNKKIK